MKHGAQKHIVDFVDVLNSLLQKRGKGTSVSGDPLTCVSWRWLQLPSEVCCFSWHMPQEQRQNQNMCETEAMSISLLSTWYTKYFGFGTWYTPFSTCCEIQVGCWPLYALVPLMVSITDKVSALKLSRSNRNNHLLWTLQVALWPALPCPLSQAFRRVTGRPSPSSCPENTGDRNTWRDPGMPLISN